MIKLSIIILSYNTKELLRKCLESIIGDGYWRLGGSEKAITQHPLPNTEIIVVDNGSIDGSAEMVKTIINKLSLINQKKSPTPNPQPLITNHQSPITLKLIGNKENLGYAKGNNIGIKEAKGKYILFLNSDTEVFPGALKEAIDFMEKNPKIGALSAKTILPSGKMDPDCHRGFPTPWASITYFLGLEKLFPKSRIFGQYHKFYLNLDENHEIDSGAGAFMLIPQKVVDEVGVWDENYFFYGEDLDFFYRIKKAGFKVMFYVKPLLKHYKGASSGLRKESKQLARNSKENRIRVAKASIEAMEIFYKKFYKDVYPSWLTFLVLTAIRIKGLFRVAGHYLK